MVTINYYDNVKDSVRDDGSGNSANFETLRKAAEEESEEEREGDDTEIEVLKDGIDDRKQQVESSGVEEIGDEPQETGSDQPAGNTTPSDQSTGSASQTSPTGSASPTATSGSSNSQDLSSLEDKLDRIIEQNDRMIEILESFGS